MNRLKKFSPLFAFASLFLSLTSVAFGASAFRQEIKNIDVKLEGSYWVSDWVEVEIPENLASFQIISMVSPNVHVQITDLIAPDGTVYARSDFKLPMTIYSQPIIRNVVSLNRTSGVVKGISSVIVPNNPLLPSPPAGVWKFRALNHNKPEILKNSFIVIGKGQEEMNKNKLEVRVWISPDSYWTEEPDHVDKVLAETRKNLLDVGVELQVLSLKIMTEKQMKPMELPEDMATVALKLNNSDALNVYFMPIMKDQSKPVNGLACIAGPLESGLKHPCFVSLYADPAVANSVTVQSQGKILTHEIGHYLGLYHTVDEGFYLIKKAFDTMTDTSEEITGENMMDPGIHNVEPHFSAQQKSILRLSPILR